VISEAQKRGVKLEVAVHLRGEVPVWEQGNMDLYTPEILVLRHDLRHDRGIVHEIEKYWHIAGMAKTADGEYLHKVGYCRMLRCFYAALLGERDEAHAQQLADEDWERDTNGAKMLSHEQFQRSLFELADLWCEGVEPAEYVEFLRRLHGSVTCELGDASHGQFHDLKEDGSDAHHARNTKGLQEVHSFAALEGEGRAQEMRGGEMVHCGEGGGGDGGNPRGEPGGGGNTRRGSVDWVAPEWDDAAEQHCRFLNTDEIEPIPFPEDEAEDDSSSGEDGGGSGGSGGGGGGDGVVPMSAALVEPRIPDTDNFRGYTVQDPSGGFPEEVALAVGPAGVQVLAPATHATVCFWPWKHVASWKVGGACLRRCACWPCWPPRCSSFVFCARRLTPPPPSPPSCLLLGSHAAVNLPPLRPHPHRPRGSPTTRPTWSCSR
jgi:hypothetical protein